MLDGSVETTAPSRGSVATARRALSPDLARGAMLFAIAVAHAPLAVANVERGPAALNELMKVVHLVLVHNHARPLFAFLFGYALVQLLNRQSQRNNDPQATRTMLRRRGLWLVAFGFAHVALLVPIDILAAYGIASLVLVGLLKAKDSTLLWAAGLTLVPATAMVGTGLWLALSRDVSSYAVGSIAAGSRGPWELFVDRLQGLPFALVVGSVAVLPAVLIGMWAARRQLLDEPAAHRRFLARATVSVIAVSVVGALPAVLMETDVWAQPSTAAIWAAAMLQPLTGYFGGVGLAGAIALCAIVAARHRGRVTTGIQALGQRSLSMYLFQSIVLVAVFTPFGLGLEDDLGVAGATGIAVVIWLLSLLVADLMHRVGHRGPAEILLRRLTYRRT